MTEGFNIAQSLASMAATAPEREAVVFPRSRRRSRAEVWSFRQLNELCDAYAHGLQRAGLERGMRSLVMIRPGVDLIATVFALLKLGAVPVLIDPGLERRAFLVCVRQCQPRALVGIPLAQIIRRVFGTQFKGVDHCVIAGVRWFFGLPTLREFATTGARAFTTAAVGTNDEAAVAFTSGSTGPPKGVLYRHGNFAAQVRLMRSDLGVEAGEIHLSLVNIFALFNPALGVTTVLPDIDPANPTKVDADDLADAVVSHRVTFSLGSPTIWGILTDYCIGQGVTLPTMKKVFLFGAPVPPLLIERLNTILDDGAVSTPFGATEALPITQMGGDEILRETAEETARGAGVCIGRPVSGIEVDVIAISDEPIAQWDPDLVCEPGEIGELVVKGDVVTDRYVGCDAETARAKICDGESVWHRMGDLGYYDAAGRLWFCGRKSHRVTTEAGLMLPIPCETIFNRHPDCRRTALVGIGSTGLQRPVLVVEPLPGKMPDNEAGRKTFIDALLRLGEGYDHTRAVRTVLFHPGFPMDVRHRAKIRREVLAEWAAEQVE